MTVREMFEQSLLSADPELHDLIREYPSLESIVKRFFFAGAKCIVALAGDAIAPQFPGDTYHVKGMVAELTRVDQETTMFLRNPDPPSKEEVTAPVVQ